MMSAIIIIKTMIIIRIRICNLSFTKIDKLMWFWNFIAFNNLSLHYLTIEFVVWITVLFKCIPCD